MQKIFPKKNSDNKVVFFIFHHNHSDNSFCSENSMRNSGYVSVALQEVPEKLILVSRPLKERFVMNPAGGEIHSASIPEVAIAFPPKTLNTPTKLVLQVSRKITKHFFNSLLVY